MGSKLTKLSIALLIISMLAGCASKTQYGRCVGINQTEDPKLEYEYSARNIILGIIFVELIAPPVIVVLNKLKCPVGEKK